MRGWETGGKTEETERERESGGHRKGERHDGLGRTHPDYRA